MQAMIGGHSVTCTCNAAVGGRVAKAVAYRAEGDPPGVLLLPSLSLAFRASIQLWRWAGSMQPHGSHLHSLISTSFVKSLTE